MLVNIGVSITDPRESLWHRRQGDGVRVAVANLVPRQRRRHARVRLWPYRVGARNRTILGVLVVIEEHAVALFFPPLARRKTWRASLHLARKRQCRPPHLAE